MEYLTIAEDGKHEVKIGLCERQTHGRKRTRVIVFIDGHPHAEFLGADDFGQSGEVLSEIKIPRDKGERICRYREEHVPERYSMFNIVGLPLRIKSKGVHKAWAVVANIGDHKTLISLAGLRRLERIR